MYTIGEYKELASKYGLYASWAIWDYQNANDTIIIDRNIDQLHPGFVLLGLNISRQLDKPSWSNYHDNTHARKLKYACNDTILRGSYMTDIFKDIVAARSSGFKSLITDKIIRENVDFFNQEMKDIRLRDDSRFIVFGTPGSTLAKYFNQHFRQVYRNPVLYYYHYAYFTLSDKEWVSGFWKLLNISQNADSVIDRYKTG